MKANVHDIFKIISKQSIGTEDIFSLSQMYMPIIGIDSFSLYVTLTTLKENEKYSFKKLLDLLNLGGLTLLKKAFSKLEAVALLKTYYHEQRGYLFRLLSPLPRILFLENTLLSSFLSSQIGEVEFERLRGEVKIPQIRGYQEKTKTFDEVYKVENKTIGDLFSQLFKVKSNNQVQVKNSDFDYLFFKMGFDTGFIDQKLLDDEEFKQNILNISYNYQLNEEEMMDVILKTITIDKDLKYEDISKNARSYYQKKNKKTAPSFVTKEADVFINSVTDETQYRFIQALESLTPEQLLRQINGDIKPAVSELKLIEDLTKNTGFPPSIIYIMILFVHNEKEGTLPGYNYFEKIANTWARAGLKTPMDVLAYLNKAPTTTKKTYSKKQSKTKLPEWYNQYEKQLDQLSEKEDQLSDTEIEKILEEARKLS